MYRTLYDCIIPLSLKLKKIYPLSLCEIRVLKVEKIFENSDKPKAKKEKIEEIPSKEKIDSEEPKEEPKEENKTESIKE
jgi:hypothetical protein